MNNDIDMTLDASAGSSPDPTEQLMREISRLQEVLVLEIASVEARLQGEIDTQRAIAVQQGLVLDGGSQKRFEVMDARTRALEKQVEANIEALDERLRAEVNLTVKRFEASHAAREAIKELTDTRLDGVRLMLEERFKSADERHATQTKALDAAFDGQQVATNTAFSAAESARLSANIELERVITLKVDTVQANLGAEISLTTERFRAQQEAVNLAQRMAEGAFEKVVDAVETRAFLTERLAGEVTLTTERFRSQQEAVHLAQTVADKSAEKLATAVEARFESVNEFRAQLSEIMSGQITRAEAEARLNAMDVRVLDIKEIVDKGFTGVDTRRNTNSETRADSRANVAIMIAAATGVLTIIAMIITNMIHISGH